MGGGAFGRRLGDSVGVQAPPTLGMELFERSRIAVTRVVRDESDGGYRGQIAREAAVLVCLELRDIASHPYWVDGRPTPMAHARAGQFTLLDLTFEHASYLSEPLDCLATYIPQAALKAVAAELGAGSLETLRIPPGVAVDDIVVRGLGMALLPALQRPEQASRLFLDSVATALLTHLAATYGDVAPRPRRQRGGLAPWQLRRAQDTMRAAIDGNLTLQQLADLCGLSRSHFARAFKRSTGLPPHRWLLARRVEMAQDMLLTSALTLEQIALGCGFADQSHLSRVFAAFVGTPPGEWRRQRRT